MNFNEYQVAAAKTAIYPEEANIVYPALGLAGEAGEVSNKVKKIFRDDGSELTPERRAAIGKEIGDILWYCAALATDLDLDLESIAQNNVDFLASRQERGTLKGDGDNR